MESVERGRGALEQLGDLVVPWWGRAAKTFLGSESQDPGISSFLFLLLVGRQMFAQWSLSSPGWEVLWCKQNQYQNLMEIRDSPREMKLLLSMALALAGIKDTSWAQGPPEGALPQNTRCCVWIEFKSICSVFMVANDSWLIWECQELAVSLMMRWAGLWTEGGHNREFLAWRDTGSLFLVKISIPIPFG
jgi:hypothetical protein